MFGLFIFFILATFLISFIISYNTRENIQEAFSWSVITTISLAGIYAIFEFLAKKTIFYSPFLMLFIILILIGYAIIVSSKEKPVIGVAIYSGMVIMGIFTCVYFSELKDVLSISFSQLGNNQSKSSELFRFIVVTAGTGITALWYYLWVFGDGERGVFREKSHYLIFPTVILSSLLLLVTAMVAVDFGKYGYLIHNLTAVFAFGLLTVSILIAPYVLKNPSYIFKFISMLIPLIIFILWLPTGLRFMHIIRYSSVTVFQVEVVAFVAIFVWMIILTHQIELQNIKNK